jgi:hypothetical protein
MKKLTFTIVLLIGIFSIPYIKAQTEAGIFLLGLSSGYNISSGSTDLMTIGFSSTKLKSNASGYTEPDPDKATLLNFIPKVGFFVVDNLAVGLDMNFAYSRSKSGGSNDKYTTTYLLTGPFVRYYIPVNKIHPFIEGSASFGTLKDKSDYEQGDNYEYKDALHSFSGGAGIAAPIGEKAALDVMACYLSMTSKSKDDNPDNERTVSGAFAIRLGFTFFLGKGK